MTPKERLRLTLEASRAALRFAQGRRVERFTTSSPQQCVSTGVASAALTAVFHTLSPLR